MDQIKSTTWLLIASFVLSISSPNAFADDSISKHSYTPIFIPTVYTLDNAWNEQHYDFTGSSDVTPLAEYTDSVHEEVTLNDEIKLSANEDINNSDDQESDKPKSKLDNDFVDKIVKKIPYGKSLKNTWEVIKGDEDILSVEGLRIDRGNMGLSYRTDTVPYLGKVDGMKIKANLGRSQKVTFESDYVPLMGHVKGFKFKASAGEHAAISFRYNTKLY